MRTTTDGTVIVLAPGTKSLQLDLVQWGINPDPEFWFVAAAVEQLPNVVPLAALDPPPLELIETLQVLAFATFGVNRLPGISQH
jgi:hypothetical protein